MRKARREGKAGHRPVPRSQTAAPEAERPSAPVSPLCRTSPSGPELARTALALALLHRGVMSGNAVLCHASRITLLGLHCLAACRAASDVHVQRVDVLDIPQQPVQADLNAREEVGIYRAFLLFHPHPSPLEASSAGLSSPSVAQQGDVISDSTAITFPWVQMLSRGCATSPFGPLRSLQALLVICGAG